MKITILTLFPEMFRGPFDESIIKRSQQNGIIEIKFINIRDYGIGRHKIVDDKPYGGGVGMVMKVDVLDRAITAAKDRVGTTGEERVYLLDPRGEVFTQTVAISLSKLSHLILLCGHYEGVDERVRTLVDGTISLGDFIVTGGEIPAMIIVDAVGRLVDGVLKPDATNRESFSGNILEYPQYTTPSSYKENDVPSLLRGGNHALIEKWKKDEAQKLTLKHRPDLLKK